VTLWGSGRDAMRALLAWGRERRGWRRVHCPSFYCQDVVRALASELDLVIYPETPLQPASTLPSPGPGEVLLVVNVYGLRRRPDRVPGGVVIEDHTHDPWSDWAFSSRADYAVASLRKTLPVPDGGALWSPRALELPEERPATASHAGACLARLSAMVLKAHYLQGDGVAKETYRALAVGGERVIGTGCAVSGVSDLTRARLPSLPTTSWRQARIANRAVLRTALGAPAGVTVLDSPFAMTLIFEGRRAAERRDRMRAALAAERVYTAVLWPLAPAAVAGIPAAHVDLADRVLTVHCDFRYATEDMLRVADRIRLLCREP
jgi:hypothetical protein